MATATENTAATKETRQSTRLRHWPTAGREASYEYELRTNAFDQKFMAQHGYTSIAAMAREAGVHLSMFSRIRSGEVGLAEGGILGIMAAYKGVGLGELFYIEPKPQAAVPPRGTPPPEVAGVQ